MREKHIRCPNCGAKIEFDETRSENECPYCHTGFVNDKLKQKEEAEKKRAESREKNKAKRKKFLKAALITACAAVLAAAGTLAGIAIYNGAQEKILHYEEFGGGYMLSYAGGNYSETEVAIPSQYKDKPVVKIADEAFKDNLSIKRVTIPASVKEIGADAFSGCTALERVIFEDDTDMKTLGSSIFFNTGLVYIELPRTANIPTSLFLQCSKLKAVFIKAGVTGVGIGAFSETAISEVFFSGTETDFYDHIGAGPFTGLPNVTLRSNVLAADYENRLVFSDKGTYQDPYDDTVFYTGLSVSSWHSGGAENITIPGEVKGVKVIVIDPEAFKDMSIKSVTISENVIFIGNKAFLNCGALHEITLPKSLKYVYPDAFSGCTAISRITMRGRSADDITYFSGNEQVKDYPNKTFAP